MKLITANRTIRRIHRARNRRGAAAVEFALVAPVFFMFSFACVEFARVNMLCNTAEIAATEGARAGVIPGATASQCVAEALQELNVLGVSDPQVTVQPTTIIKTTPSVKVTVTVPLSAANGYIMTPYFVGRSVERSIELKREN